MNHPNFDILLEQVRALNLQPIDWVSKYALNHCYALPANQKSTITENTSFELGSYYIQGLSSLFAAIQVQAHPGEEILDLTAAPGGKTLILAKMMQQQGRLAAVEYSKPRFF